MTERDPSEDEAVSYETRCSMEGLLLVDDGGQHEDLKAAHWKERHGTANHAEQPTTWDGQSRGTANHAERPITRDAKPTPKMYVDAPPWRRAKEEKLRLRAVSKRTNSS